ncbi:flagellar protein FliL [Sulfuriferula plumbiphila]|uniref:Flagellar protein FliL n=1 Tax=Sulfuriferula plumbiphila TaxID=171865 RepID=A0A512L4C5_9PROT|nr:flagellar basal body-associated protein FliL [Sulfuriferula plumbiphila]BBP03852.1 flagellar protein FliL [Sulfuriferula plumbiphila]GEP29319.1 flagellar protein FliL [Sulfuriferula plumbiphila]
MAKAPPKPEPKAQVPAVKSKKPLFLILGVAVLVLGGAGTAGWYFIQPQSAHSRANAELPKPPVFINMEPFTVNLQSEDSDKFLQTAFTLQVKDDAQVELIKLHMPQVRSRLLMLLSSQKAAEILTPEGKNKLAREIIAQANKPFEPKAASQSVTGVFFTSFVIQ